MFLDKQWHQDKKLREKLAECINAGRKADLEGYVKACLMADEEPHFEALQHSADFWLLHSAVSTYDAAQGIIQNLDYEDFSKAKNLSEKGIFNLEDQLWDHANHLRDIEDFTDTITYECSLFRDSMREAEKLEVTKPVQLDSLKKLSIDEIVTIYHSGQMSDKILNLCRQDNVFLYKDIDTNSKIYHLLIKPQDRSADSPISIVGDLKFIDRKCEALNFNPSFTEKKGKNSLKVSRLEQSPERGNGR
jgi:hypothetical protein